jgi:hypothetical protein
MTLAGLGYAGLWAVAPIPVANTASMLIVAIAMLVTLGYGVWTFVSCCWQDEKPVDLEGRV